LYNYTINGPSIRQGSFGSVDDNPTNITYVGLGGNGKIVRQVNSFQLTVTAIPEPSSHGLLGLAFGGILWQRRITRRRKTGESIGDVFFVWLCPQESLAGGIRGA
jgi:hypothetical protein